MEVDSALSDRQVEQVVDELNLAPNICPAHPPNLPLPHHVDRNPGSFAAPPETLEILAWHSRAV
jgi:hypothetical protein